MYRLSRVKVSILTPYLSNKPWYPEIKIRNNWIFQQVHRTISSGWILVAPFFILGLVHSKSTLTDHFVFFYVFRVTYAEQIWVISSSLIVIENLSSEASFGFFTLSSGGLFSLRDFEVFRCNNKLLLGFDAITHVQKHFSPCLFTRSVKVRQLDYYLQLSEAPKA